MAVFRELNICPICGEQIKEAHLNQKGIPPMMQLIGDTFLRYEDHVCKPENIKFHYENIVCPECDCQQLATVEHTIPFYSYVHECVKCGYIIMESEWQKVTPIFFEPEDK